MKYRHASKVLRRLDEEASFHGGYGEAVVRAFRMRMQVIRAAVDETVFYAVKSLHYEKLKGPRRHQHSMRLNDRWRLILEIEPGQGGNVAVVIGIEDYH